MGVEVKFTCNICGVVFKRDDGKASLPLGWGVVTPMLRVNLPTKAMTANDPQKIAQAKEMKELKDKLKSKLDSSKYHICHECLRLRTKDILSIEGVKKNKDS